MITNFSVLANLDELGGNEKVILVTPTGLISGNVMMSNSEDPAKKLLSSLTKKFSSDYKEKYSLEDQDPYDGYVVLEDAEIISSNGTTNSIPFLMVFFDQIIGITLGEIHS